MSHNHPEKCFQKHRFGPTNSQGTKLSCLGFLEVQNEFRDILSLIWAFCFGKKYRAMRKANIFPPLLNIFKLKTHSDQNALLWTQSPRAKSNRTVSESIFVGAPPLKRRGWLSRGYTRSKTTQKSQNIAFCKDKLILKTFCFGKDQNAPLWTRLPRAKSNESGMLRTRRCTCRRDTAWIIYPTRHAHGHKCSGRDLHLDQDCGR